jgi:putative transposase
MRRIDELRLDYLFAGSRMLQGLLRGDALETGRLRERGFNDDEIVNVLMSLDRKNVFEPLPGNRVRVLPSLTSNVRI